MTYTVELFTYQTNLNISQTTSEIESYKDQSLYNFKRSFKQKSFFRMYFFTSYAL